MLAAILSATWKAPRAPGLHGEIARVVDQIVLFDLMALSRNDRASPQTRALATAELVALKAWLAANNCSYPAFVIGSELYTPPGVKKQIPRFSIDGGPITLAQLLDQIAIKSGENFWAIVQTFPEESCVVDIYMLREHWPVTN